MITTLTARRDGTTAVFQVSGEVSATVAHRPIPAYTAQLDALHAGFERWAVQSGKDAERLLPERLPEASRKHVRDHVLPAWRALQAVVRTGLDAAERRRLNIATEYIPSSLPFASDDRARWAVLPLGERIRFIGAASLEELAAVAAMGQTRAGLDDALWVKLGERLELLAVLAKGGIPAQFPAAVGLDNLTGRGVDWVAAEAAAQAQIDAARQVDEQAVQAEKVLSSTVTAIAAATSLTASEALALLVTDDE